MTLGVRQRHRVFVGFDEQLRSVAADDREKRIPIRLLESRLETKLVAVEGDGLLDVADDEEWRNRLRARSCHKHGRSCSGSILRYVKPNKKCSFPDPIFTLPVCRH